MIAFCLFFIISKICMDIFYFLCYNYSIKMKGRDNMALPILSQSLIDITEYFDNFSKMSVQKIIKVNTKDALLSITFYSDKSYPYTINLDYTDKNRTYKYLFRQLTNHNITLKSSISDSKRTKFQKKFFELIEINAAKNTLFIPTKPGLSIINFRDSHRILLYSNNIFPFFYPYTYSKTEVCQIQDLTTSLSYAIMPPTKHILLPNIEILFLLTLRYLSLLLPLYNDGFRFRFPYIVTFSSHTSSEKLMQLLSNNLSFFINPYSYTYTNISSINAPFDILRTLINERNSNCIFLEASFDAEKIRKENINLICDYFTNYQSDSLCCVASNTIQYCLPEDKYIDVPLDDTNLFINDSDINSIDTSFLLWITSTSPAFEFEQLKSYNEINSQVKELYRNNFNSLNIQDAVTSIMTVFRLINQKMIILHVSSIQDNAIEAELFKYVSGLFETQIAQENTETTIKKFSDILSNCILDRKVNVFAHSKHNKNRIAQHNGMEIYKNNQKLIIPSNVFEKLCSSYNISLIKLKKALQTNGSLFQSDSLYITKLTMYPIGQPSIRGNAYIINDNILDPSMIEFINAETQLVLSDFKHSTSEDNGIAIGYNYKGEPVIWSYTKLSTCHLMITGKSGYGKTTFISKVIKKLNTIDEKILILDFSQSYINNDELKDISNVYKDKLPVNPFVIRKNETKEAHINRIVRSISQCFKLIEIDSNRLNKIISEAYISENSKLDLNELKLIVPISLTKAINFIVNVYENSEPITWSELNTEKNMSIISIDNTWADYEVITEFLLQDLYDYKQKFDKSRLFLVVDEIQNLINNKSSSIITILSQGRDKGIGLIMSTQSFKTIPTKYRSMFLQSGLNVFFQPEIVAIEMISKLIYADSTIDRVAELMKRLEKGESVVYGSFENENGDIESDKIIYVSSRKNESPLLKYNTENPV